MVNSVLAVVRSMDSGLVKSSARWIPELRKTESMRGWAFVTLLLWLVVLRVRLGVGRTRTRRRVFLRDR